MFGPGYMIPGLSPGHTLGVGLSPHVHQWSSAGLSRTEWCVDRPFNFLDLGTPCNFPEGYFGFFSAVQTTYLPFNCRPKSGPFAF
jgi:hypothetical protein